MAKVKEIIFSYRDAIGDKIASISFNPQKGIDFTIVYTDEYAKEINAEKCIKFLELEDFDNMTEQWAIEQDKKHKTIVRP